MSTVCTGIPFSSSKERFRIVKNLEREMRMKRFRHKIEVDDDRGCIICFYDDKVRIHN